MPTASAGFKGTAHATVTGPCEDCGQMTPGTLTDGAWKFRCGCTDKSE